MTLSWESVLTQVTAKLNAPLSPWSIDFQAERTYYPKKELDKLATDAPPFVPVFPGIDHSVTSATRRTNRVTYPVAIGVGRKVNAENAPGVLDPMTALSQEIRMYLANMKYDGGQTGEVRIITPYDPVKYQGYALFQSYVIVNIFGYEPVR